MKRRVVSELEAELRSGAQPAEEDVLQVHVRRAQGALVQRAGHRVGDHVSGPGDETRKDVQRVKLGREVPFAPGVPYRHGRLNVAHEEVVDALRSRGQPTGHLLFFFLLLFLLFLLLVFFLPFLGRLLLRLLFSRLWRRRR